MRSNDFTHEGFMSSITPIIAGNWKMNGLGDSLEQLQILASRLQTTAAPVEVVLCLPATLIERASRIAVGTPVSVGGQDCHAKVSGAHTGDVAAEMLADAGATYVILGHSERRTDHAETDDLVSSKVAAAHRAGLIPIVCVGETLSQRESGQAIDVVSRQVEHSIPADGKSNMILAYEPVWAIGTGLTPTVEQIAEVHGALRASLVQRFGADGAGIAILYGGSVKPGNAGDILRIDHVNGALVGGASLKADDFEGIIRAV
jgi:triosephosphate isomerase